MDNGVQRDLGRLEGQIEVINQRGQDIKSELQMFRSDFKDFKKYITIQNAEMRADINRAKGGWTVVKHLGIVGTLGGGIGAAAMKLLQRLGGV